MSCVLKCGCQFPIGILQHKKTKVMISCQTSVYRFSAIASNPRQTFTADKEGYYLVILAATGGNINTVFNRGLGVEHCIVYIRKNQTVDFSLGSDSLFKMPNGTILTAKHNPDSMLEPKIAFQYLGDINTKGRVVDTFGGGYNYPSQLDSIAGYHVKGIVPLASDIDYMNTGSNAFMYWARAKVNFPETGEYTFGAIGDDYVNLYLDGLPALMYSSISSRDLRDTKQSTGDTRKIRVTQGVHEVFLWNLSDQPFNIHSGMFINNATGKKVAASDEETDWYYVRSFTDCFSNEPQNILGIVPNAPFPLSKTTGTTTDATVELTPVPPVSSDNVEWVTKRYEIPCAEVTYEVKKINGVETGETRNTKRITSETYTERKVDDASSYITSTKTMTFRRWFVDGVQVCVEKVNETYDVESTHRAEHNSNDPNKSNNS